MLYKFLSALNESLLIHGIKAEIFSDDIERGVTVNYKALTTDAQKLAGDRDRLRAILNRAVHSALSEYPMIEAHKDNRTFCVKSGERVG